MLNVTSSPTDRHYQSLINCPTRVASLILHLEYYWSQFPVEHDVEAEHFEARASADVVREAGPVVVLQHRVCRNEGLDDDVIDVSPRLVDIVAVLGQPTVYCRDTPGETNNKKNWYRYYKQYRSSIQDYR